MNNWKPKADMPGYMRFICPCCNTNSFEFTKNINSGIIANIESEGKVPINNFWELLSTCENPLCEWSKVKINK